MKKQNIPKITIQRLTIYIQVLENLSHNAVDVISSDKLAQECGVASSQIRKDLSYFGEFGVRGVGYHINTLLESIRQFLNINREWRCALVGVGNLGRAILRHKRLREKGFIIKAAFDCDPFKIGEVIAGFEVICTRKIKEKARAQNIEIGLITTPPQRAQRAANHLLEAGIKGIMNFTNARLQVPENVVVDYVDFSNQLITMAYDISNLS